MDTVLAGQDRSNNTQERIYLLSPWKSTGLGCYWLQRFRAGNLKRSQNQDGDRKCQFKMILKLNPLQSIYTKITAEQGD